MRIRPLPMLLCVSLAIPGLALAPGAARAQTTPAGFTVEDAFPGQSFTLPTQVVFLPDGRKLVVEKEGRIWTVTAAGVKLTTPFIDINTKVLSDDDRGLHGVALDPDFATNRWVYLLYTADPDSDGVDNNIPAFGRVERYQTSLADPNVLDPSTRQILIGRGFADGIPEPARNMHHMVGMIRFGADKTLMIGSGDAGDADLTDAGGTDPSFGPGLIDPAQNIGAFRAQWLNSMDGKLLRVDKETGHGLPSNPYWNGDGTTSRSRVWLYGVRNPFRFAFRPGTGNSDPSLGQPGVLYVGDVGWNNTEELDIVRAGGVNLGWPCYEGVQGTAYQGITSTTYPNANVLCSAPLNSENPTPKSPPVLWWDHSNGALSNPAGWVGNCAIGGVFCPGLTYPVAYQNLYFIADYGVGWIKAVRMDANDNVVTQGDFVTNAGGVVDIETDPATGELWYVDINSSSIRHVRYSTGEPAPIVNATVTPSSGFAPLTVTASASASNDPDGDPLTFAWNFGDGHGAIHADTSYTYTTSGSFTASVTVSDGHGGIATKQFPIVVGQQAPPGKIVQPVNGVLFYQNQPLSLQASPVDTTVTPASYRWDVDLGHNNHLHPSVSVFTGRTAVFQPVTLNDGGRYYFRVRLTVTQGLLSTSDTVFIYPRVNLTAGALSSTPVSPGPLAPFVVATIVHSNGEMGSPPVPFRVLDGASVIATGSVPAILQGDSLTLSATVGPLAFGDHVLSMVIDPTDSLVEVNESDNVATGTVTVSGLIAAYGMDQGSGTTITDASGHGYTGGISGATWANPGKYGRALSFNGSSNYVDLGNPPLLATTGSMTWSAWVRMETTPADDGIIIGRSDDNTGWQLKTTPDTGPRTFGVAVSGGPGVHTQRYSITQPVLHTWYHVAGVYNAPAGTLDLYVNGALDDGAMSGFVPPLQYDSGLATTLGRRNGGYYFGGLIDEVRIYNRALTPAEIQTDMNTPLASGSVNVPGDGHVPSSFAFGIAGPNPFVGHAALAYSLPREERVRLEVFDITGHLVATLEDGVKPAGAYTATFEPRKLASGLYLCRFEAGGFTASRKLFLVR